MSTREITRNNTAVEDKLDSILHPKTHTKEFKITIEFGYKLSPNYKKAVAMARKNPNYREKGNGEWIKHSATYCTEDVDDLHKLFLLVHDWDSTEILVNHKRIPYGHQLWLPLMWFYRIK